MTLSATTKEKLRSQHYKALADYDLCVRAQGVYIDIVQRFDKQWRATIGSIELGYFPNRGEAVDACLNWKL